MGVLRESARRKKKTIGAKRMVETPSMIKRYRHAPQDVWICVIP